MITLAGGKERENEGKLKGKKKTKEKEMKEKTKYIEGGKRREKKGSPISSLKGAVLHCIRVVDK